MANNYKLWLITTWEEYRDEWPSIAGPFDKLTDHQASLGYKDPEDFFTRQSFAAQTLANDRVGGIIDNVFSTEDINQFSQQQLKKYTYQAIDFLRMNDTVINIDIRNTQISFNNSRSFSSEISITRIEESVGPMAWRSWTLSNIERLYQSYCEDADIPYLLDPTKYYNKEEIDKKLGDIDDTIQYIQVRVDKKLTDFNDYMIKHLDDFTKALPNDQDFIDKVVAKASQDPKMKGETGAQVVQVEVQVAEKTKATLISTLNDESVVKSNIFDLPVGPSGAQVVQVEVTTSGPDEDKKAKIISTLSDETSIESNEFNLPRGAQGPAGSVTDVPDPTNPTDAANKRYTDKEVATKQNKLTAGSDLTISPTDDSININDTLTGVRKINTPLDIIRDTNNQVLAHFDYTNIQFYEARTNKSYLMSGNDLMLNSVSDNALRVQFHTDTGLLEYFNTDASKMDEIATKEDIKKALQWTEVVFTYSETPLAGWYAPDGTVIPNNSLIAIRYKLDNNYYSLTISNPVENTVNNGPVFKVGDNSWLSVSYGTGEAEGKKFTAIYIASDGSAPSNHDPITIQYIPLNEIPNVN